MSYARPGGRRRSTQPQSISRTQRPRGAAARRLARAAFALEPVERRVMLASVAGTFFQDLDGDGVREAGEAGLPNWTVFLDANQNGTFDGTSQSVGSTDTPMPIPDVRTPPTRSTLAVGGIGTIADVNVAIDITHTYNADLDVFLVSPAGTRVELFTDVGGNGDGMNVTLDQEAGSAINSAPQGVITGTWRPEGNLAALYGAAADGNWTLEITDDAGNDSGTLQSWALIFSSGERSAVSGASGAYTFLNVEAGTYDVRQVNRAGWNQTAPAGGFHTLTLDASTNATNIDFGNRQPPGTIRGTVFSDYDSDGAQGPAEPGLGGWTVYLDLNDSGTLDAGEASQVSGANGAYEFINLAPRQYVVREVLQPGYVQTVPGSGGVILDGPGAGAGAGAGAGENGGGGGGADVNRCASQTEIVVAFKGAVGKGNLKREVQADRKLAALVDYAPSRDMFTVDGVTLVEVKLRGGADPHKVVDAFAALGKVKWAQVNYVYEGDPRELTPNDPQYGAQYHHPLMGNNLAWDLTQGRSTVVIGVTDDGNDFDHQDLYLNIWINQDEIPASRAANLTDLNADGYLSFEELNNPVNVGTGKAVDTNADGRITGTDLLAPMVKDGNGADTGNGGWADLVDQGANTFVDDLVGRDFWNNDNNSRPPSGDTHGTHVTGIAVARTDNGVGVAGTAGRATVMPIRFYSGGGGNSWTSTMVSNAYKYGTDNGAQILTTSYNVDGFANDNVFAAALNYMYGAGVLHFNSAGNTSAINPVRQKFDTSLYVVNTDSADRKSSSSAWGWGVDISAPGTNILSTYPNNTYQSISGTSMASPNAAAVAALIWSQHPTWTREQVAAQLLGSADNIDAQNPSFAGLLGAGRANANRALTQTIAPPRVKALAGLPADGGTTLTKPSAFTLDLASVFDPASISAGSFSLSGMGLDEQFGTADDTSIPITVTFGGTLSSTYRIGTNRLNFTIPGPMGSDTYRLAFAPTATDPFGQPLDGNGDGTGGDAFTRTFTITGLTNPYRVTVDAGEIVEDVDFGNHDRRAPQVLASSFNFATSQQIVIQFNEDVRDSLSVGDMTLENLTAGTTVDTSGYTLAYDNATNTATISVNAIMADANYQATFAGAGIEDPSGNALAADHVLDFFFLQGDATRDATVNLADFNVLAANFGQAGTDFTEADFNYDGQTNLSDFNILAAQFGKSLAGVDVTEELPAPPKSGAMARAGGGSIGAPSGGTTLGPGDEDDDDDEDDSRGDLLA
jgi:subtilisin family serine protease/subtilisin-like proprotein convertase family protein